MAYCVHDRSNPDENPPALPERRFRITVSYVEGQMMTKGFDEEAFRAKCEQLQQAGLDKIEASSPDRLAVMMKFIDRMLTVKADGRVTAKRAYACYHNWSTSLSAIPMPYLDFQKNLRTFIETFGGDRIAREKESPAPGDSYRGITLHP